MGPRIPIAEKLLEASEFVVEQMQNVDSQLGFRQKAQNFSWDFKLKWKTEVFLILVHILFLSCSDVDVYCLHRIK